MVAQSLHSLLGVTTVASEQVGERRQGQVFDDLGGSEA